VKSVTKTVAVSSREDPALRFVRRELAPSRDRWIATLASTGLAVIGVIATVTFRIPYPVLVFAGILLLTAPPAQRPFRQAVEATGAALLGAAFAVLLAITTYDQPWLYLPLQCAALTVLLVLSRTTAARPAFILAALILSFAEPAYLPDPDAAIGAALFNALALAGVVWAVAAASVLFVPPAAREDAPRAPGRRELIGFALLALSAIGLQKLFYNTINLPEIRTGVIAVLLTADPDLRAVWRRMPLRQLCAASCAALALLMIAVGAPLMDDLGFFSVLAGCCYFAAGWVAHGGPRIAFASVPGAITVTLVLLLDVRFTIDIIPSLLNVAGVLWGMFVTALIALALAPLVEQRAERGS
jgi:membrane-associated HD superfamily phosphohydrolase